MKKNIKFIIALFVLLLVPFMKVNADNLSDYIDSKCSEICENEDCMNQCTSYLSAYDSEAKIDKAFFMFDYEPSSQQKTDDNSIGSGSSETSDSWYWKPEEDRGAKTLTCDDVSHLTNLYFGLRVLAPLLLIIFGSLDFLKAVVAADEKKQKEARSKFPKRLVAFLLLLLVPFFISYLFKTFGTYGSQNTSIFCCIVTNGSEQCEYTMSGNTVTETNNQNQQKPNLDN